MLQYVFEILPGYFGEDCGRKCKTSCASGHCNRMFGYCECSPGLFGPLCNLPCPEHTWGSNCVNQCDCIQKHSTGCEAAVC